MSEELKVFIGTIFFIAAFGMLSYWFHWDEDFDGEIDYRIEQKIPEVTHGKETILL